jgi:hypothetical protein
MKKRPTVLLGSPSTLGAHQALAAAVIRQALVDAADPQSSERHRASARAFLAGSTMLRQWCLVAGLDLDCVERAYESYRSRVAAAAGFQSGRPRAAAAAAPLRLVRPSRPPVVRQQSARVTTSATPAWL